VELAAGLPAARDEGDAVGGLPQDRGGPARAANAAHDVTEIDRFHLVHCADPPRRPRHDTSTEGSAQRLPRGMIGRPMRLIPGMKAERRLRIGIDTGGTFTDVVAVDESTGAVVITKTPTTTQDPSLGVLEGIRKVLRLAGGGEVAAVSHGTTVATNALLAERYDGPAPGT